MSNLAKSKTLKGCVVFYRFEGDKDTRANDPWSNIEKFLKDQGQGEALGTSLYFVAGGSNKAAAEVLLNRILQHLKKEGVLVDSKDVIGSIVVHKNSLLEVTLSIK